MSVQEMTLASELTRLIREQRLSYAHIARPGQLSRNTVKQIADGKTRHPGAMTLCLIAVGLAVDPYTGRLDQETLVKALGRLGATSGYGDLREEGVRRILPAVLAAVVGDLDAAQAWTEVIFASPKVDVDRVRALAARLRR